MVSISHEGTVASTSQSGIDWTPYLAGAGIGVLSWIVFVVVAQPIGVTTAMSQVAGSIAAPVIGADTVARNSYWAKNAPAIDYGTLFLAGTFLGALVSSILNRTFKLETVPQVWRERFGGSVVGRFAAAFAGGIIAMYGARMAGGCTSGNGISGGLQLAVSGWTFLIVMFATGIPTAAFMFGLGPSPPAQRSLRGE
jgi:uncharacterized protein